jgi:WD40 repeat protein
MAGKLFFGSSEGHRTAWLDEMGLHCGLGQEQEEGSPAHLPMAPQVLAVSDSSAMTAWTGGNGDLYIHDHATGLDRTLRLQTPVLGLAFSPEPDLLACRSKDAVVFVNPVTLDQASSALPATGSLAGPIAFSADGRWAAVNGSENSLVIAAVPKAPVRWRDQGSALRRTFTDAVLLRAPVGRRIVSLKWNPRGSRLACGTADGFVQTWNVSLLRQKLRLWKVDWGMDAPPRELDFVPVRLSD